MRVVHVVHVVVVMMVMVVVVHGDWHGDGSGCGRRFLRHGVSGEAERENGRGGEGS